MSKTPEEMDTLSLLAASYACDYRDSPKSNVPPDSHLVYSVAYDAFLAGYKAAWDDWRRGRLFENDEDAKAAYKEALEDNENT